MSIQSHPKYFENDVDIGRHDLETIKITKYHSLKDTKPKKFAINSQEAGRFMRNAIRD